MINTTTASSRHRWATGLVRIEDPVVLAEVLELEQAGFELGEQWSRSSWASESGPAFEVLGTRDHENALIGVLALRYGGDTVDLDRIVVAPAARRRGVGRSLIISALDRAADRDATEMILEVRTDNEPAITLYRALGFTDVIVRSDYYGPGQDAMLMKARTTQR